MPFALTVVLEVPQNNATGAVDPLETTFAYAAVLCRSTGLQVKCYASISRYFGC